MHFELLHVNTSDIHNPTHQQYSHELDLQKYYSGNFCIDKKTISKKRYEEVHQNAVEYFGRYAGYSQQFLYKMERDLNEKKWL